VSISRVIRGEALGPQDEDVGRNRERERGREREREGGARDSRNYTVGRLIREFIRLHVATEWMRDEDEAK